MFQQKNLLHAELVVHVRVGDIKCLAAGRGRTHAALTVQLDLQILPVVEQLMPFLLPAAKLGSNGCQIRCVPREERLVVEMTRVLRRLTRGRVAECEEAASRGATCDVGAAFRSGASGYRLRWGAPSLPGGAISLKLLRAQLRDQ